MVIGSYSVVNWMVDYYKRYHKGIINSDGDGTQQTYPSLKGCL